MDWLLERQERIEKTLAKRHLEGEGFMLYDLSSSYVEGRCCRWRRSATAATAARARRRSTTG